MTKEEKAVLLDGAVSAMSEALYVLDTRAALDALSFYRELDRLDVGEARKAAPCLHSEDGRGTCLLPVGHTGNHGLGRDLSGVNSVARGNAPVKDVRPMLLDGPEPTPKQVAYIRDSALTDAAEYMRSRVSIENGDSPQLFGAVHGIASCVEAMCSGRILHKGAPK